MAIEKKNILFGGAVFILILSIISFVMLPAMTGNARGTTPVFGKWNGKPIEYSQDTYFVRQIQNITEQMKQQNTEINDYSYYQIMQSAFNTAAVRLAILEQLEQAGYKVPESTINKQLIAYYQDENGKYSPKLYEDTPVETRHTRRTVMTEELTANRYVEDVFGSQSGLYGLKTSAKETDLIKAMANPQRIFTYASFAVADYPDSEVAAYAAANQSLFVKHDVSLITFDTEEAAKKEAASLAKKTTTFDDAVATVSTRSGTESDGRLARSLRADLNALFTDAKDLETVLALKPGEISGVVKTADDKFAIARCNTAPVNSDFADTSVLAAVRSYMNEHDRGKIEDYFMAKAKAFAAAARDKGFAAACRSFSVQPKTTGAFGINYGNSGILTPVPVETSAELANAVKSETFFKKAFSLKPAEVSDPVLLGDTVLVLQAVEDKAADSQTAEMLPMFYTYYASSWSQSALSSAILKDKKLQNNFMETYLKYFLN